MDEKKIKIIQDLSQGFSILLGFLAICYLEDLRFKLLGVVLCIWGVYTSMIENETI